MIKIFKQRLTRPGGGEERRVRLRERRWFGWLRRAGWVLVSLYFGAAIVILAVRFWVVPQIPHYRADIEQIASHTLGLRVGIEEVQSGWHALHPTVELRGVRIYDHENREVLALPRVRTVIAWRSAFLLFIHFRSIELEGLNLDVRRTADGKIYAAGLDMSTHTDTHVADWLISQGSLHIKGAQVTWTDEKRAAPPLHLRGLDFLLVNDGSHHRFAMHAEPPAEHASAIDLRGDLEGRSAAELSKWNGRFYIGFDYLDLSFWQRWVDYPFELRSGRGALRLWLGFAQDRLVEAHTQLALADVSARFAKQLPLLEVESMEGEFGAEEKQLGFALVGIGPQKLVYDGYARRLGLVARGGVKLQPADFTARFEPGNAEQEERGQLKARSIDLKPLAALSDYLPLPQKFRAALDKIDPRGALRDVEFSWSGSFETPQTYAASGQFNGLGMRPYGQLPGFSNLSGNAELSEKGGRIVMEGKQSMVEYPGIFPEAVRLDSISARLNWTLKKDETQIALEDVRAQNEDGDGWVKGSVRVDAANHAHVDLQGGSQSMKAPAVYRYIPYLKPEMSAWLSHALAAGTAENMRFSMRGATADFPYNDPQRGEFKLGLAFKNAELYYASGWPHIGKLDGTLQFDGPALAIRAPQAGILGARLLNVQAGLADFYHANPVLKVEGQAEGPAEEFLKFIAQSPVRDMLGRMTEGWSASGAGKLHLALNMPLSDMRHTRMNGSYEFLNNNISMGLGAAPLNQVGGTLEFTENGASSKGLRAQYLGGPLNAQIATKEGAIQINGRGSADAATLGRMFSPNLGERLRGPLVYRFNGAVRDKRGMLAVESNLQGVSIDLPGPLNKAAADTLPSKVEWATLENERQSLNISMGKAFAMQGQLRKERGRPVLDRAGITIGDMPMPKPEGSFIVLAARADSFDIDRSMALFAGTPGSDASAFPPVDTVDLRVNSLVAGGRLFNDVNLRAQLRNNTWRASVKAREIAGQLTWLPQEKGVLRARLQYLIHPAIAPQAVQGSGSFKELPELDIEAASYTLDNRELGRLDLYARNEGGLWKVENASISAPEGRASLKGVWRPVADGAPERTEMEVDVQSEDIGRYLARLGYAGTVSRGQGGLKGKVAWNGAPFSLDYPSLQGEISLLAQNGQFDKVKPGIGKLLGVLSLQSLPRRLTLDFKDVFSEGFAFDRIEGHASIAQGVMSTQDLTMGGPSAQVAITGSVDLQRETQDLNVKVIPTVGDSLATVVGISLLNPFVGVGAWLGQKMFNDPIGRMLAFEYAVSGKWEDPKVEKIGGPQQQQAQAPASPSP